MNGTMQPKRPRSVYCSPEERDAIQERAADAGKSTSGFVLDLALEDGTDSRTEALTDEERAELCDGVRRLAALLGIPGSGEANAGGAEAGEASG